MLSVCDLGLGLALHVRGEVHEVLAQELDRILGLLLDADREALHNRLLHQLFNVCGVHFSVK